VYHVHFLGDRDTITLSYAYLLVTDILYYIKTLKLYTLLNSWSPYFLTIVIISIICIDEYFSSLL